MSLVQDVTRVPVHLSLRKAWFRCFARSTGRRVTSLLLKVGKGVAGRKVPLKGVTGRRLLLPAGGRGTFPPQRVFRRLGGELLYLQTLECLPINNSFEKLILLESLVFLCGSGEC